MTEQEKAVLEAKEAAEKAAAEKAAADAAAGDDQTDDGDDEGDNAGDDTDAESLQLKADLKAEKAARKKAEQALATAGFKNRKKKREEQNGGADGLQDDDESSDDEGQDDENQPITRAELKAIREQDRKNLLMTEVVRIATSLSENATMQELVLEKWKNRSFPADLSLQDQIEECFLAANKKRIFGENKELKRSLLGKRGVNKDASGSQQDESGTSHAPRMPAADAAEFARLGFKWNATSNRYEKKLASGGFIVRDMKTKKTFLVKA